MNMPTIQDYFVQSQLSLAAYATGLQQGMFGSTATPGDPTYQKALQFAGMSASQAADFANTYKGPPIWHEETGWSQQPL
jgi:hypothetical protein